jgi:hypothetical protein
LGQVHTDHSVRARGAALIVVVVEGIVAVMVLMRPPLVRDAAGPRPHADDGRQRT